jgi:hypothetical protein
VKSVSLRRSGALVIARVAAAASEISARAGSLLWSAREEIRATFIGVEVRRIRQGINQIEEERITWLGRAPRREIRLEVRGDEVA